MKKNSKGILQKINWRSSVVIISIFTVLILLPIAVYVYTSRTIESVAYTISDDFQNLNLVNTAKSNNYELLSGTIKVKEGPTDLGTGADGACSVTSGTKTLDTASCSGRATADAVNYISTVNTTAGSTSITLSTSPTGLTAGDEVLIINLQGTSANYTNVGKYETRTIASIVGNTLNFSGAALTNSYDGTTQKIMVQRVPNYTNISVSSGAILTTTAWNGTKGGVLFLRANGTATVTGTITMSMKGYRGGGDARQGGEAFCGYNGGTGGPDRDVGLAGTCGGGGGGGGITSAAPGCISSAGGSGGSVGGGGGGGGSNWWENNGGTAGAGGGGGYGTFGYGGGAIYPGANGGTNISGAGGQGYATAACRNGYAHGGGGGGGGTYGDADLTRLYLGSAGAQGGGWYTNGGSGLFGGTGGGIISLFADTVAITGNIQSNGGVGQYGTGGSGGGGAGGSVYVGYNDTSGSNFIGASGGTVTTSGIYTIHKFASSGTFTVYGSGDIEVLVVGGGGGGGSSYQDGGACGSGGGGAGGLVYNAAYAVTAGDKTVTIGNGGSGAAAVGGLAGSSGGNSVFNTITAYGGGGGGGYWYYNGVNGGSGGGGAARSASNTAGTGSQGNSGGVGEPWNGNYTGGGGGGAGSVGAAGATSGNGGGGTSTYSNLLAMASAGVNISGTRWIGGGGGGGSWSGTPGTGGNGGGGAGGTGGVANTGGTANTGGGGGGAYYAYGGAAGGSGIVVVRYPTSKLSGSNLITTTGGTGGQAVTNVSAAGGNGGSGRIALKVVPQFPLTATLESLDLIPGETMSKAETFEYTLSSKPTGTTATIQFSTDSTSWYSSIGVLGESDTLVVGTNNEIDLSSYSWLDSSMYYKITFGTDGTTTPALESIRLNYDSSPNAPTIGNPQALSVDTIRWNFTDNADNEEGFILVDENDTFIKYCLGENLTYCDETGLEENTQYERKIKAYNTLGESVSSDSVLAYTLLSAPTILAAGTKTSSTISLIGTGQINGSELYFDCEDTNCDTGLNTWISADSASATGLENNTGYNFRVKGRNGDNVETAYSSPITVYTLAIIPTLSAGPLSSSSISLNVEGINNLASGTSGVYFECEETDCNEGVKEWIQTSSDVVIGLLPNTQYFFRVNARNNDSIVTGYSDYIGVYTSASTPSALIEISKSTNTVKISLAPDSNPTSTEYAIFEESTGKYLDLSTKLLVEEAVWGTYTEYGEVSGIEVNGLNPGTEYSFKVKAKNSENLETDFSSVLSIVTKLLTPTNLIPTNVQKGSVIWSVSDSNPSKDGYKIYDEAGNLLVTCSISNMVNCKENNLLSNTTYSRKVKAYNSETESDFSGVYQVNTLAEPGAISSLVPTGTDSLSLNLTGSNRDSIQVFEESGSLYFHNTLKILTNTSSTLPFSSSIDIQGLKPNTRYSFKIRSLNGKSVATNWSSSLAAYTFAQEPVMVKVDRISSESAKLFINNLQNPTNTEFTIKETNGNKYLNFATGDLENTPVWGKFSDFGGSSGILVQGLEIGKQYGFAVQARNTSSVLTDLSSSIFIGTSAILKNVNTSLSATLLNKTDIDLTIPENGQFGEKSVRVSDGEYLVVDVPVLFEKDRDWADAVIKSSPNEKKSVVKFSENNGVFKPFTMYVVGEDTNTFVLCPSAKNLDEVSKNCSGGVKYTGPFPQSIEVEGNKVYVSQTVIGGVKYWVADGLTGTGGIGFYEEEKDDTVVNPPVVEENNEEEVEEIVEPIKKDNALGIIANMEEPELQAVTIAVGTTAVLGGISQFAYGIGQFFLGIFSALGYRRKRIHYGFVYDSKTKEPIHMAVVRIFDKEKKLVNTEVTNANGRITGNLAEGVYTLQVSKKGFKFPSESIKGREDYPISNIYTGTLTITSDDSNIQIAIPMDPTELSNGDRFILNVKSFATKALSVLNVLLFLSGISLSIYMYDKYPQIENLLIGLVYILPLYTLLTTIFNKKGSYGKVVDDQGQPVSGVSVFVKESEFNKVMWKRVTNENGKYRFILDKGKYTISIDDSSYAILNKQEDLIVNVTKDNYVLSKKIKVKKI
ncbi:MAG: glycine-rich domain-containing protein [Candidatus Dojkabacteria bacterium]